MRATIKMAHQIHVGNTFETLLHNEPTEKQEQKLVVEKLNCLVYYFV
jgi:hypothetical protein